MKRALARTLGVLCATVPMACGRGASEIRVDEFEGRATEVVVGETFLRGRYETELVESYPSDAQSFTQGFEIVEGRILTSSGLYGGSWIRLSDLASGEPARTEFLAADLFAEGLTAVHGNVVQLTWREGVAQVWSLDSLKPVGEFQYEGEGWGLCFDGTVLVMSDGTDVLTFRDPDSFEILRSVQVSDARGRSIDALNELECVGEQVFANRYLTDDIVVIDPIGGRVDAVIDASAIRPAGLEHDSQHVLNGIAYDADLGLLLTGKFWPTIVRVELVPD